MAPFMNEPYPIQKPGPKDKVSDIPLILLHDGGGTVLSYLLIHSLGMPVYGISNPHFKSGGTWEGGVGQMAQTYADMIRKIVPEGPMIIGGWSFGGMISVEISHILSKDKNRRVVGIIMMDSVCPYSFNRGEEACPGKYVAGAPSFPAHVHQTSRMRVTTCMKNSAQMLREWTLPRWDRDNDGSSPTKPPPTVLLRCRDYAPTPPGSAPGSVARVDVVRTTRDLGWGEYHRPHKLLKAVLDIGGHHYNLFNEEHIYETSAKLRIARDMILAEA